MKFQILKLIIWSKSEKFAPRVVEFKPGHVNVITGASRTGKSAIIPIIDYCLAASDCFIPIDTIRDHASWYGVVFQTETDQILICRKAPIGNKVSNEFYLYRASIISLPPVIKESNETSDGVKHILNALSSVPYFGLSSQDDKEGFQARLGFRDLMALVFQNQDIVANQNILFYKTHAHEHRERLRNWFPYILGAENLEILTARQRLQLVEKKLFQLRRELEKVKTISAGWMSSMIGQLNVAKEYGLLEEDISPTAKPDELLAATKAVIEHMPEHSKTDFSDIGNANKEISQLNLEMEQLSAQIGIAKKRLDDVQRLKAGLVDYGDSVRKRTERLQISQWIEDVSTESQGCPACGGTEHPNAKAELVKISTAFKKAEEESKAVADIPTSFVREEERVTADLQDLLEQKKNYEKRFDLLRAKDKQVQEEFQRDRSMFLFLGHLKASMETFENLTDGGDFQTEIALLEIEYKSLQEKADYKGVQRRLDTATAKISQGILKHLTTLDVEEKYRKIPPKFSVKELNILVQSNDEHWHFLAEVGSASNWVAFHLALMCSLQEYFLEQKNSCVPSFVIFDQPSQVYFPKLKKSKEYVENVIRFEGDDVDAVKRMFRTLANSVLASKGLWQGIVLDHADSFIYGDIEGVYEVEEWINGKKLIPKEWYEVIE